MSFLSRLRIGQRLTLSYALLILLLIVIGAFGAHNASRLSHDLSTTANSSLVKIALANTLESDVNIIARASRDLLLLDTANAIKRQKNDIAAALEEGQKQLAELEAKVADVKEDKEVVAKVREHQTRFAAAVSKFLTVQQDGSPDEAREALIKDVRPAQKDYQDTLKSLVELQFAGGRALAEGGAKLANQSIVITGLLVVIAVVIGGVGGLTIARSIIVPARKAKDAAQAISSGDLSQHIDVQGSDELAQMLHAMRDMQTALSGVVASVSAAAGEVAQNSNEIAGSNVDLSDRTARSAESLQNTAASVEQIASNLNGASELTRKAASIASKARQSASAGGTVVSQVVSTMEEISASSRKIGDIIGVIDGIAFQTNILALNAAVEAARAGEQGRGFAVVAGEVRNLAQRSAEAAKEIKGLIGTSVDKVESGSKLVADAGQTMNEIVASVQRVTDIIGEITAAASEQSDGIGQVNVAVTQLDQMTQQNAALVEESAAAAESLKDQAHRLVETVRVFQLEGAPAAH